MTDFFFFLCVCVYVLLMKRRAPRNESSSDESYDEDEDRTPLYGQGQTLADYFNQINGLNLRRRKHPRKAPIQYEEYPLHSSEQTMPVYCI